MMAHYKRTTATISKTISQSSEKYGYCVYDGTLATSEQLRSALHTFKKQLLATLFL